MADPTLEVQTLSAIVDLLGDMITLAAEGDRVNLERSIETYEHGCLVLRNVTPAEDYEPEPTAAFARAVAKGDVEAAELYTRYVFLQRELLACLATFNA